MRRMQSTDPNTETSTASTQEPQHGGRRRIWRLVRRWVKSGIVVLLVFLLPLLASIGLRASEGVMHWSEARRDSSGVSPLPAEHQEAVVQVFAARAWSWRGALGVHTWIVTKPAGANVYTRWEVIGWGVRYGRSAIRVGAGIPDGYWFGSPPMLLADVRGEAAEAAIAQVRDATASYPYADQYSVWPGPNSNTFIAHVLRLSPGLQVDLPPTAIGKDYLVDGGVVARTPSGTGWQVSLAGLAGLMVALDEGLEVNLLGFTIGVDFLRPALKLPGIGRLGFGPAV